MLFYLKIPDARACPGGQCVAFEKYDGTNMHWDWERDFGWHAFGTRRDVFNLTEAGIAAFGERHSMLAEAPQIFLARLAAGIDEVLRTHPDYRKVVEVSAFCEFLGPGSFAGLHKADDPKSLKLFDVELKGQGFVAPARFVLDFGHLETARVVFRGKYTGQLAEDVRNGKFGVSEGVVLKGGEGAAVWMVKIKTFAYLERLKRAFGEHWETHWES